MPTKTKASKTRTKMKKLPAGQKNLSREQKKRVKGGLLPANTAITPIGGPFNTAVTPVGTTASIPKYSLASPLQGPLSQLLDSELSAAR